MWTRFWDMRSGGSRKLDWDYIFIETNKSTPEALQIFKNAFGRDTYHVTCSCCGDDYSVTDYDTLERATEYLREDKNQTMEQFLNREDVKVLYAQNDDKENTMLAALRKIAAIENREFGPDWEEIEEARQIANDAIRLVTGEG